MMLAMELLGGDVFRFSVLGGGGVGCGSKLLILQGRDLSVGTGRWSARTAFGEAMLYLGRQ